MYHQAVVAERAKDRGLSLSQQMSSKRFKKNDPSAEQWKVCPLGRKLELSRIGLCRLGSAQGSV